MKSDRMAVLPGPLEHNEIKDLECQPGVTARTDSKVQSGEVSTLTRRVLVCGGRDYADVAYLNFILSSAHKSKPLSVLIHGAARGADSLARDWAHREGVPTEAYPADWNRDGKSAGPLRNLRMLAEGKPDLVIAFPGGKGTAHMRKVARAHGVNVIDVTGWDL